MFLFNHNVRFILSYINENTSRLCKYLPYMKNDE
jgi:hypothetical protein